MKYMLKLFNDQWRKKYFLSNDICFAKKTKEQLICVQLLYANQGYYSL